MTRDDDLTCYLEHDPFLDDEPSPPKEPEAIVQLVQEMFGGRVITHRPRRRARVQKQPTSLR